MRAHPSVTMKRCVSMSFIFTRTHVVSIEPFCHFSSQRENCTNDIVACGVDALQLGVMLWLHVKWNYVEIILKLFRCFVSHVSTAAGYIWNESNFKIISVFYFTCNHVWNWNRIILAADGVLKLFWNHFGDNEHVGRYSWAANKLVKWNYFRRTLTKAEMILFHM